VVSNPLTLSVISSDGILYSFKIYDDGNNNTCQTSIWVDVNGAKPPNQIGKDTFNLFAHTLKEEDVVYLRGSDLTDEALNENCSKTGNGSYCGRKIQRDGWEIKDDYPWL
jgi:hypothetical protein